MFEDKKLAAARQLLRVAAGRRSENFTYSTFGLKAKPKNCLRLARA
jgi:hypothetical protein